jgi:hypothetical protein
VPALSDAEQRALAEYALIRAEVEVRISARTVEIFHRGQRVAVISTLSPQPAHARSNGPC